MKKLFLVLTLTALLLGACTPKNEEPPVTPPDNDEIVQELPEDETPIEPEENPAEPTVDSETGYVDFEYKITTRDWVEAQSLTPEEIVREFLSALYLGDREALELYYQGDTLDELLKVKFSHLTYKGEKTEKYYGDRRFEGYLAFVSGEISESESEYFKEGPFFHNLLVVPASQFSVDYFGMRENYRNYCGEDVPKKEDDPELWESYTFIEELFRFGQGKATMDFFNVEENFDAIFHVVIHALMAVGEDHIFETTAEDFKTYVKERLGYTDEAVLERFADKLASVTYASCDENGVYKGCCAHGYSTLMRFPYTAQQNGENKQFFSYGIFADSAFTQQCAQVSFWLEKKDGAKTYTLTDIKYDEIKLYGVPDSLTPYWASP